MITNNSVSGTDQDEDASSYRASFHDPKSQASNLEEMRDPHEEASPGAANLPALPLELEIPTSSAVAMLTVKALTNKPRFISRLDQRAPRRQRGPCLCPP